MTLIKGLPEVLRADAARLYWQAFGTKLGRVLGPDARALHYLTLVIRSEHAFVALDDRGRLVGMAGFKTPAGSFAGGTRADLATVYGRFGGWWRGTLLAFLGREIDNSRFLIDGICVAEGTRSQGIGSRLISAICNEARDRGYQAVRLDVVDDNLRARALYERLGFVAVKSDRLGPLRWVFGFKSATTMVKPVGASGRLP
jgi:ribosomal protein S18 acetylase RimI-like enzyme